MTTKAGQALIRSVETAHANGWTWPVIGPELETRVAAIEQEVRDDIRAALERDQANHDVDLPDMLRHTFAAISRHESATEDGERPGLREAAQAVIVAWDDKWIGCSEMGEPVEALRAALAATPIPDDRDRETTQQMASGTGGTVAPVRLIPSDDRDREVERIAAALAATKDYTPEDHREMYGEGDYLDAPHEWFDSSRVLAAALYDAGLRASGGTAE